MTRITEIPLPGVGVRHEFTSASGQRVAIVSHRSGRRELAGYKRDDPDACTTVLDLGPDDTAVLAEILGAPPVAVAVNAMHRTEGLTVEWLPVGETSSAVGATIAAGGYRTRTGASIVAVVRQGQTHAAPDADFELHAGDVVVAVGTPEGLEQLGSLLKG